VASSLRLRPVSSINSSSVGGVSSIGGMME
jgi:hypothetical protein